MTDQEDSLGSSKTGYPNYGLSFPASIASDLPPETSLTLM
jgi:hypothetical protein